MWAISVPILAFLGLSVLELGPMYTTDRRQTKASVKASDLWRHNNPRSLSVTKVFATSSHCKDFYHDNEPGLLLLRRTELSVRKTDFIILTDTLLRLQSNHHRPSVVAGKQIFANVGDDAAEGAHDHRQFLAGQPRLCCIVLVVQSVHAGHPALIILAADQHDRVAVFHRSCTRMKTPTNHGS